MFYFLKEIYYRIRTCLSSPFSKKLHGQTLVPSHDLQPNRAWFCMHLKDDSIHAPVDSRMIES